MSIKTRAAILVRVLSLDWLAFRRSFVHHLQENALVAVVVGLMGVDLAVRLHALGRVAGPAETLTTLLAWSGWIGGASLAWMMGTARAVSRLRTFLTVYEPRRPGPPMAVVTPLLGRSLVFAILSLSPLLALHFGSRALRPGPTELVAVLVLAATCGPLSVLAEHLAEHAGWRELLGAAAAVLVLLLIPAEGARESLTRWTPPGLLADILRRASPAPSLVAVGALGAWAVFLAFLASASFAKTRRRTTGGDMRWLATLGAERVFRAVRSREPYLRRELLTAIRWPRFRTSLLVGGASVATLVLASATGAAVSAFRVLVAFVLPAVLCSAGMSNAFAADGPGVQVFMGSRIDVRAVFRAKEAVHLSAVALVEVLGLSVLGFTQGGGVLAAPGLACAVVGFAIALASSASGRILSVVFAKPQQTGSLSGDLASAPAALLAGVQGLVLLSVPALAAIRIDSARTPHWVLSAVAAGVLAAAVMWRLLCVRASVSVFRRSRALLAEKLASGSFLRTNGSDR